MKALIPFVAALAGLLVSTSDSLSQDAGTVGASSTMVRTGFVPAVMPQAALENKIEGYVEIIFTVAKDGTVKDLQATNAQPPGVFEEAALAAVSQWTYQVVTRKGEPVEQRAMVRVKFALPSP